MNKNEQIERQTIQTAIENLEKTTGFKAIWELANTPDFDAILDIEVGGKRLKFLVEAKTYIRNHNLPTILAQAEYIKDLMVVADHILPGIKEELRQRHIAYLEGNGNIYIDKKPVFVWVDNNKPLERVREKPNRAFTKAGLQVVFLFLTHPRSINETYRVIAEATNTALGNVNNVINGLLDQGFIVRINKDEFAINNRKALIEKWVTAYEEKLKPGLFVGNFRFAHMNADRDWKEMDIDIDRTVWGGEPGGDILTNHLRPEILTLYTNETRKELMDHFRIVPDVNGQVKVYKKFWTNPGEIPKQKNPIIKPERAAPPILVYADLMNTNNKRCIETAQIIYERYIEPII